MPPDSSTILIIPLSIIERNGYVALGIDVLHYNKHPNVIVISKHIKYMQCVGTTNKNVETFLTTTKRFKSNYMISDNVVKTIFADRSFESCKTALSEQGITLLCCETNSHIPFIEHAIRFLKERVRCVGSILPKEIK